MRALLLAVCFALVCATVIAVDVCEDFDGSGCNNCVSGLGGGKCGYCWSTQKCVPGNATGPATGECLMGWSADDASCPNCDNRGNCMDCKLRSECTWCSDTSTCRDRTETQGCHQALSCKCSDYEHCDHCQQLSGAGCGWCAEFQACENRAHSSCKQWSHSCPACDQLAECGDCLSTGGCSWCATTDSCVATTLCPLEQQVTACTSVCQEAKDCDLCNQQRGCSWCEAEDKCFGADERPAGCLLTHVCTRKVHGFDGGSFAGGMGLAVGLLVGGVGAFFGIQYYRSRSGGFEDV